MKSVLGKKLMKSQQWASGCAGPTRDMVDTRETRGDTFDFA